MGQKEVKPKTRLGTIRTFQWLVVPRPVHSIMLPNSPLKRSYCARYGESGCKQEGLTRKVYGLKSDDAQSQISRIVRNQIASRAG
jgi:hypothetical protein